ncbi:MAG: anthranilate phosphoribosyltransferase [Melioribacteraceae bacterium]
MIKHFLEKITNKESLSLQESIDVMNLIMQGQVNNSQIAGLLVGLKAKGEAAEEVAGFALAMRQNSIKINSDISNTIDLCGTGGDYAGTFNISTAASFVAAGAGIKVAKHGNRAISSNSGSADVLKELGININLTSEQSEKALNEVGIAFLFAPLYHPAMKYVAPVRGELGIKTIFNILGPLTNPAGTKKQLIGTFNYKTARLMSQAAKFLDMEKVCFVCTADRFDEVSLNDITYVNEYKKDKNVYHYSINNETFSYPLLNQDEIRGGSPKVNAEIIFNLLTKKERGSVFNVVAVNAAVGLYAGGYSDNIKECLFAAEESIVSDKAYESFIRLKEFSERV